MLRFSQLASETCYLLIDECQRGKYLRKAEVCNDSGLVEANARCPDREERPDSRKEPQPLVFQRCYDFAKVEVLLRGAWCV